MLQHQPESSSLATATATSVERLPRWVSSLCQRRWSRVWQRSARDFEYRSDSAERETDDALAAVGPRGLRQ